MLLSTIESGTPCGSDSQREEAGRYSGAVSGTVSTASE